MPRSTNNRRGALRPGGRGGSTREWRRIRERILKRDNNECAYCGGEANSVDHVIPYAHGGTDNADNLVAACLRCNRAKSDRMDGFWKAPATSPTPLPPPSPRSTVTTHTSYV
jgi:5-methylcytosine-specific restriction endonuclease McrA